MTLTISSLQSSVADALPPSEDEILLERMRNDDQDAYRLLVERHIDRAYGLALRVLKNTADAEDVTQDCMIKAWQHRKTWQAGRAKFETWLYRVIVNRCIDLQRRPKNEWLDDVPEPSDGSPDSVETIQRQQVSLRLEDAMGLLPTQQRTALVLSYYEGLSNIEIADIMGTTISATESLLKRGRQGLRKLLKRSEGEVRVFLADQ
jgi:RNA polymerase sigma-70 factor, ECF subfamily